MRIRRFSYITSALDGRILDCNSLVVETMGYKSKEELIGKPLISTVYAPSSQEKARKLYSDWKRTGQLRDEELQLITKHGEVRDVLLNLEAIYDEGGHPFQDVVIHSDMTKQKRVMQELMRQTHDLGERVKELNCLYSLDEISRGEEITIEKVLKKAVRLIPPAWQYPETTECCITLDNKTYKTRNFKRTRWIQRSEIVVGKRKAGVIDVCYLKERPERDEGPFLKEEKSLINSIATRLGQIIEHKNVEKMIRDSEERLRTLFEYAPDAYYLNDLKGNFIDGNKEAERIIGYKREELIGKSFLKLKLLPPKQIPKAASLLAKNLRGKPTGPDELDLIRKDGTLIPVEIRTFPVKIKGQTLVLGIARDITERKKADEFLRDSEEKYRELINTSVDAVISVDSQMRVILWNPAAEKIFGYSEEEMLGQTSMRVVPNRYKDLKREGFARFRKTGSGPVIGKTLEIEGLRKDGTEIPVELSVYSRKVGKSYVATAIIRDISERKQTEEAIIKRKNQLELIHKIQNEIPMNVDIETILKISTESIGRSFGCSKISVNLFDEKRKELVHIVGWNKSGTPTPRGHRQELGEGLIGAAARERRTIVANDVTQEPLYRVYYQTKTKSEITMPLLVENHLIGVLDIQDVEKNAFTMDDIAVLQSIANYLAYVIDEKQTEEALQASLKEKEVLLREIHHRVKNNLQVISSLLNLQSHHIKGKKNVEMFKDSQNRVKSMALIHEKLYQSQDLAKINFKEYIQTLVNGLFHSYKASPGKIALKVDVEDVILRVNIAIPCGLIINELVSNSLKYAFPDGRQGEIRIGLHTLNEEDVELMVRDNGVGLPEELDFRNTRSLGLYLVTILAEDQLRGEVELNRKKGTEFRIKLRGVR